MVEKIGDGFVYNTDDELVSEMERLLADGAFRDELGRRGLETVQREWSADAHLGRYMALIKEIGARRDRPPPLFRPGLPTRATGSLAKDAFGQETKGEQAGMP
jgi:hypothetical protein